MGAVTHLQAEATRRICKAPMGSEVNPFDELLSRMGGNVKHVQADNGDSGEEIPLRWTRGGSQGKAGSRTPGGV